MTEFDRYRASRMATHDRLRDSWLGLDLKNGGENPFGLEFKHDHHFAKTGNLYIEVAEKAHPRDGDYAPSGVNRTDNTWLWAQGDEHEIYVFMKHVLRREAEAGQRFVRNSTGTSWGFLLPIPRAREIGMRRCRPAGASDGKPRK